MAVATDESFSTSTSITTMESAYEFSAPRFFDFTTGESEEDTLEAELWFENALSHAPSPFMPRIKTGRSFKVETVCDFREAADQVLKTAEPDSEATNCSPKGNPQVELLPETKEEKVAAPEAGQENFEGNSNEIFRANGEERQREAGCNEVPSDSAQAECPSVQVGNEACTPEPLPNCNKDQVTNKKRPSAEKIASLLRNPSALKQKNQLQSSKSKSSTKLTTLKRETNIKNTEGTPCLAQENQAIKRQKLEGGKSRQILNPKPLSLPHKSKLGLAGGTCSLTAKISNKLERKVYVWEQQKAEPFVSMAEKMKKFQSNTRELSLPHANSRVSHGKARLKLTTPKETEFETAHRVRSITVKSTAEIEEEMMAKVPKFKARPVNKKILEDPVLLPLPSTPKLTEFQDFHFKKMERASQNAETSSVALTEVSSQKNHRWKSRLREPKTPVLQTSLRARPPTVKSSIELEQEELEKVPKFKARPLNRKIFESKGEMGVFCTEKKQATIPQAFHFAMNERIPPLPPQVFDLFDKLSLNSGPRQEPIPRNTIPNPFHLHTEERGAEKERRFLTEAMQKQLEEERARVPKAKPYPYTTDYPVIPPKPDPKQCTRPEPFQLESLVRHEEEMQREMKERQMKEKEEAKMRVFKAQPVLKEDPIPVPEKVRKPLTQVQEPNLHVDNRAVDRAEFYQKIKEKEMMHKRHREESEAAKMAEEERALKQLRRTMVPHARPVPKFDNPFCPQKSSKGITKPKSPKFRVLGGKEVRKMVVSSLAPTSSPATIMR